MAAISDDTAAAFDALISDYETARDTDDPVSSRKERTLLMNLSLLRNALVAAIDALESAIGE
jgi:hypothetical protein